MQNPPRTNPFINRQPLEGGGREVFLSRIRKSLGHPAGISPAPTAPPAHGQSLIRQVGPNDPNRITRFIEKAQFNTMVLHRVAATPEAVHAGIDACLANHKIAKSLLNARDLDSQFHIANHLATKNIEAIHWGSPNCREAGFQCDASITDCRAGLADTGSIMVYSDPSFGRTTTLVVPVHIVLLPASRILPDMIDGLDLVLRENPSTLPSNIVFINGPSKTGDIEMKLVTGVHGPKFVYILLIDGM